MYNYRYSRDSYELKNKLLAEMKNAIYTQMVQVDSGIGGESAAENKQYKFFDINKLVFVYEWTISGSSSETEDDTKILGLGQNVHGRACYLQPSMEYGLFGISSNIGVLTEMCRGHNIKVYNIQFDCNNFALYDLLQDYERYTTNADCYLVKIVTQTPLVAQRLYTKLRNDERSYRYISLPHYWDVTKNIMFELMIRQLNERYYGGSKNGDETKSVTTLFMPQLLANQNVTIVPNSVNCWFDKELNVYHKFQAKPIPLITFDIETISSDPHRVPDGSDRNDILFTTAIHHVFNNKLYSLIYIPIKNVPVAELEQMIRADGYNVLPEETDTVPPTDCENILEVFTSEIDLLRRTMALLTVPDNKLHYLVGYNSLNYDIKYLLVRCVFYNLHEEVSRFVWHDGYSYGLNQIHLDLFRIIMMRYRFKQYTLNAVSQEILKESKTGVSAVALRYTFARMQEHNRYFVHSECDATKPSVRDTLHYNNADTLLVSKLLEKTHSIEYIVERAMACQVPLSTMNVNYNKMQYKLWNECFTVGLNLGVFLSNFKPCTALFSVPLATNYSPNDYMDVVIDLTANLQNNNTTTSTMTSRNSGGTGNHHMTAICGNVVRDGDSTNAELKKAKYPGGANFCLGEFEVDNVQIYDYVTAYPKLIDRMNLSDETASIIPANILLSLYYKMDPKHLSKFRTYDYLTHSGNTKTETIIQFYQYIYNNVYCGDEFEFTPENLYRRQQSPVIIVWYGRRGVLAKIVTKFSEQRLLTKTYKTVLQRVLVVLNETIESIDKHNTVIGANAANGGSPTKQLTGGGWFKFECTDNEYLFVSKKSERPYLNINLLAKQSSHEALRILNEIRRQAVIEFDRYSNSYDLQKTIVCSIYGGLGKLMPVLAAIVTCRIRTILLNTAGYLQARGYTIYYTDTDSIMIHNATNSDLSPEINQLFPQTEMSLTTVDKCLFVQKKTYYKIEDGVLKYGQHVNGPKVWRECIDFFYAQKHITTNHDIYMAFYNFFNNMYLKLLNRTNVDEEFIAAVTQTITVQKIYKTTTVAAKYKEYLRNNYPALADMYKHNIYYHLDTDVRMPCLRPQVDLRTLDDVKNINLFKYYQNVFSTIYNIIKFTVRRNNAPHSVTLANKFVLMKMMEGYVDVYLELFGRKECKTLSTDIMIKSRYEILTKNSRPDAIFEKNIYTETFDQETSTSNGRF